MPKADGQSSFPPRAHWAVTHRAGTLHWRRLRRPVGEYEV